MLKVNRPGINLPICPPEIAKTNKVQKGQIGSVIRLLENRRPINALELRDYQGKSEVQQKESNQVKVKLPSKT